VEAMDVTAMVRAPVAREMETKGQLLRRSVGKAFSSIPKAASFLDAATDGILASRYLPSFVAVAQRHTILWNDSGTMIVLCCSLILAHLSYKYLERPFRKLKERFTLVPSRDQQSKILFEEPNH
jgi:hypothetical protein